MTGRGGVAVVYKATHKLLDRTVAIKIISHAKSGDVADKRFLKEARVVAGLRHPNIVSIYDVGVLEDKYYIIMEFLEGGDLKQKLEAGLSVDESIGILKQMASALAHAHDKGFIHRDIKSQNIMFRSDGTAVLTDFGIVKDLTVDSGYTMDGTSVGTPHYMSPEQAQGSSAIDWRTDLYSLGVTFYEMITGSVPYTADSAVAVALKHIKDPVPKLPAHLSRYQTIIDRLMAKRPEKRFQSAHELLEALERLPSADKTEPLADTLELTDRTALHAPRSPLKRGFLYTAAVLAAVAVIAGGVLFFGPFEQLRQKIGPFISQTVLRSEQGGAPAAEKTEAEKAEKEKAESPDREAAPPASAEKMPIQAQPTEKPSRKASEVVRLYQSAQALFEQGNYTAALELTRQALSQAPDHKELKKLLLLCKARISVEENRLSMPDDDNALAYYRQLFELDPDNPEAREGIETIAGRFENQARSAYQDKDYDRALDNIAKYREIRPADEDAELMEWMIRGSRQYAAGRYLSPEGDSAAYYFRKVLEKAPQKEAIARRLASARVLGPLSEIDPGTSIQDQLPRFQKVFKAFQAGIEEHGAEAMGDVRQALAERIKAVVDAGIERSGAIPDAFISLVTEHLPEFSDIFQDRYEGLVTGGDDARGLETQADFYLKALRLNPSRDPAREKIKTVARQMVAQGDAQAVGVLKEAMNTVSDDGEFKAMLERIQA
ncbi:MAG: protein kinase domain-containing protein, partial [Thermodesulfobacteriota bacterium]